MVLPEVCAVVLVLIAVPVSGQLKDMVLSEILYETAVADVINEEFARLAKDIEKFTSIYGDCTKKLNKTSEACQDCLKTVDCGTTVTVDSGSGDDGGGGRFKPIDLIHLVNPIDFLKEPLKNIVSKVGKAGGKFVKNVGKHLVKGLKAIAGGFDDTVIDGLKDSLKGLEKLGSHLGKAVKGLGKGLGKITKSVGKVLKGALKTAGKGVKHVFKGVKKTVKAVGKGVKHVFRGVGRGIKSGVKAVGRGVKKVWRGFKKLFGRRRRSAPNAEDKACMAKCPACVPFISGKEEDAMFSVCGADVVLRNATVTAEVALFDKFFNDANEAQTDLLKEVKLNTTSGLLSRVTALVRGQYRVFSTDVQFVGLDPDGTYKNLARYIYKIYLVL